MLGWTRSLKFGGLHFYCHLKSACSPLSGIGYFTLPYLVHAGASHVHACEWNPDAVAALRRNLQLNKAADRCTVHQGDNKQVKNTNSIPMAFSLGLCLCPPVSEGIKRLAFITVIPFFFY